MSKKRKTRVQKAGVQNRRIRQLRRVEVSKSVSHAPVAESTTQKDVTKNSNYQSDTVAGLKRSLLLLGGLLVLQAIAWLVVTQTSIEDPLLRLFNL